MLFCKAPVGFKLAACYATLSESGGLNSPELVFQGHAKTSASSRLDQPLFMHHGPRKGWRVAVGAAIPAFQLQAGRDVADRT